MNRVKYIDSLKGIAIICVVLGHVANGYLGEGSATGIEAYRITYNLVYAFHMPLFFILSGFLFRRSYFSGYEIKRDRIKKQLIGLVILYFMYSLLLGVFKMLFGGFVNNKVTVKDILMIPIKPIQLYWYIYVLVFFYLIFSIRWVAELKGYITAAFTFVLLVVSYWIPGNCLFEAKRFCYYMFFFCIGGLLSNKEKELDRKYVIIVTSILTIALYVAFWNHGKMFNEIWFVNVFLGLSASLSLFYIFRKFSAIGENKVLSLVGRYSLEIYLLHTYVITAMRTLFHKLHVDNALIMIVITFVSVVLPILIASISKRIKLYNLLFSPTKLFEKTQ